MIIEFETMNYTHYSNVAHKDFERMLETWQKLTKMPSTLERKVHDGCIEIYLKSPCEKDELVISYDVVDREMTTY